MSGQRSKNLAGVTARACELEEAFILKTLLSRRGVGRNAMVDESSIKHRNKTFTWASRPSRAGDVNPLQKNNDGLARRFSSRSPEKGLLEGRETGVKSLRWGFRWKGSKLLVLDRETWNCHVNQR